MVHFYEIAGFVVAQDGEFMDGHRLVIALKNNAGVQLRIAEPRSEMEISRTGKQFFCISALDPFSVHRGFNVDEYHTYEPSEHFTASDPEGNEVFVQSRPTRRTVL